MKFDVSIDTDELQREWSRGCLPKLRQGTKRALQRAIARGVAEAKARVPVSQNPKGTHLRDEIYGRLTGEVPGGIPAYEGEIVADKPYAKFVEGGTREHVVRPRSGKWSEKALTKAGFRPSQGRSNLLAWQGPGGEWHFAREVTIPAIPAHPFMGPAYLAAERSLEAELELAVQAAIDSFNSK